MAEVYGLCVIFFFGNFDESFGVENGLVVVNVLIPLFDCL